jgi:hypothetical protein
LQSDFGVLTSCEGYQVFILTRLIVLIVKVGINWFVSYKSSTQNKNCQTEKLIQAFSIFFLNVADNCTQNINTRITSDTDTNKNYKYYLNLTSRGPFSKIILKNVTTKEI